MHDSEQITELLDDLIRRIKKDGIRHTSPEQEEKDIETINEAIRLITVKHQKDPAAGDDIWPENLLLQMGIVMSGNELADTEVRLDQALSTLTETERRIIVLRFRDKASYDETARETDSDINTVKKTETKAIRKLRHPSRTRLITADRSMIDDIRLKKEELAREQSRLADAINEARSKADKVKDTGEIPDGYKIKPYNDDTSVEELGLSIRSHNCLKRAGVTKIKELEGVSMSDLMKIRNLGRRSMDEIADALSEYGIIIRNNLPDNVLLEKRYKNIW